MNKAKTKCLLINPWIYDLAAANMWSSPLGLLKVAEYLSQFDIDVKMIDCTATFKTKKFGAGNYHREIIKKPEALKDIPRYYARYGMGVEDFRQTLQSRLPCDLILVTSIMSYWYPGVQKAINVIRSISPDTPIILGGIYATLYHEHARDNTAADYIHKGALNEKLTDAMDGFGCKLRETAPPRPFYDLGLCRKCSYHPLLTSCGCPFKCSYCASSLLHDSFKQRDPIHVVNEIKIMRKRGVCDFAFYDDALFANADSDYDQKALERLRLDVKEYNSNSRKNLTY